MTGKSKPTIAVLYDNEIVRDSLAALLEAYGFHVTRFASALELLDGHSMQPVDCLVLEVHLPGTVGLNALKLLRERQDGTEVILITGSLDPSIEARSSALGAAAVLYKPVAHSDLLAAIQQALAKGRPQVR